MTVVKAAAVAGAAVVLCVGLALSATGQEFNDKPLEESWWPSDWGPDDKAGSVNRTTPEMVLKAVQLVKQGKTATLGKLLRFRHSLLRRARVLAAHSGHAHRRAVRQQRPGVPR